MTPKQKHRWLVEKTALFVSNTDGCFVECGVKQGTSSRIMATVLRRRGYLFDTWTGFPHYSEHDIPNPRRKRRLDRRVNQTKSTYKECRATLKKGKVLKYCSMIRGDILGTVPKFVKHHSINIVMLHIDTDLYDPAQVSLKSFFPFVQDGGIVLVHDYGDGKWPGINKVVNSFITKTKCFFLDHNSTIDVKIAALSKIDLSTYFKYIVDQWKLYDAGDPYET